MHSALYAYLVTLKEMLAFYDYLLAVKKPCLKHHAHRTELMRFNLVYAGRHRGTAHSSSARQGPHNSGHLGCPNPRQQPT